MNTDGSKIMSGKIVGEIANLRFEISIMKFAILRMILRQCFCLVFVLPQSNLFAGCERFSANGGARTFLSAAGWNASLPIHVPRAADRADAAADKNVRAPLRLRLCRAVFFAFFAVKSFCPYLFAFPP